MDVEFRALFLWNVNVCCRSDNSEMCDTGFVSVPHLVGCRHDCACWTAIFEVYDRFRQFHPKPFVEFEFRNNRLDPFHDRAICPFCDTVLVWAVGCCRFVNNPRSEEHTSELQSQSNLVCRLLLEKKKKKQ